MTTISVAPTRGRYGGRPVKRRKTVNIRGVGIVPRSSIFPASARGKYRQSGMYGRFGRDGEMKFIDSILVADAIANTGEVRPSTVDSVTPATAVSASGTMLQIAQGDQAYMRNGRKIMVTRISGRLILELPSQATAALSSDIYRILMILDKQANGAAPATADVLGFTGQTISTASYNNLENSSRFRVLFDVLRPINSTAGGTPTTTPVWGLVNHVITFSKRCKIPVEYSASASTGALNTIRSNNLLFVCISKNGAVTLGGNVRVRYSDN